MAILRWSVCEQDNSITLPLVNGFREKLIRKPEVEVISIPWVDVKQELAQIAIYRSEGLDVSQAGAPLINDLVAMNALRPLLPREVTELGDEKAFVPIAWQHCLLGQPQQAWAVPMFADPRAIIYWGDMLDNAGIEQEKAFSSVDQMKDTFQRLRASGVEYPWMLNIRDRFLCLQGASSWLWNSGVDFVTPDGGQSEFASPAGLDGLAAHFDLKRFMRPDAHQLSWQELMDLFTNRKAAATLFNLGAAYRWYQAAPEEYRPYLRIAVPLQQAYVGGSNLVIWGQTRNDELAFTLVKYLLSPQVQRSYPILLGQLPVRLDVLHDPNFSSLSPIHQGFINTLATGRMYPNIKFGGLLEDQLVRAFDRIWQTLLSDPTTDTRETIARVVGPIARRYDNMVSG
jgi:ABC-type glycerol-3-phosphate transport system substrate-binding protein